ncbi:hypothetical protein INR49_020402 [Caranx melampygus]|nr:hypothetical protein INR49_020402 [Caranx melampygus]
MVRSVTTSSSSVVLLLLGERLSGKSSAGNAILGHPAFHSKTTHSSRETGTIFGKRVTVVDTPGWLSHSTIPYQVSQELCRGLSLCQPQPDVLLLVLPTTSTFSPERWRAMELHLQLLQTNIWQRAMVLFTHGDELGGVSIQEHIRRQGRTLHWLLERCGNRYQVVSNHPGPSGASRVQIMELFGKIQKLMEVNRRPPDLQARLYTQLRREVSMREEERRRGRQEEIEMTVMGEVRDGRWRPGRRVTSRGKSSVGNWILDREEFEPGVKASSCRVAQGLVSRRSVTVVVTPGWSLFCLANPEQVRTEISRSPFLCPQWSRVVFLLVVPLDSYSERERRATEAYLSVLGEDTWRRTVVVFTYADELRGETVERHVEREGRPLQWLLDRCGRRHHVFLKRDAAEVHQLLETVDRL